MKIKNKLLITGILLLALHSKALLANSVIPPIAENELKIAIEAESKPEEVEPTRKLATLNPEPSEIKDSEETDAIKITPDKPEIVTLERDAVNVIVGSNQTLRVIPDTNRALVLVPKKPGSTYFKALDINGKIIMQRHVIVGVAKKDYVRIRRTCAGGDPNCREFSVYYCPDMCHEVNVMQDVSSASPAIPEETVSSRPALDYISNTPEAEEALTPVLDEAGNPSPPPLTN